MRFPLLVILALFFFTGNSQGSYAHKFYLGYDKKGYKLVETFYWFQQQKFYVLFTNNKVFDIDDYQLKASKGCLICRISKNYFKLIVLNKIDSAKIFLLKNKHEIDSLTFPCKFYPFDLYTGQRIDEATVDLFPEVRWLNCEQTEWGEKFHAVKYSVSVFDSSLNSKYSKSFTSRIDSLSVIDIKNTYQDYDFLIYENIIIEGENKNRFFIPRYVFYPPGYKIKNWEMVHRFFNKISYKFEYKPLFE